MILVRTREADSCHHMIAVVDCEEGEYDFQVYNVIHKVLKDEGNNYFWSSDSWGVERPDNQGASRWALEVLNATHEDWERWIEKANERIRRWQ